MIEACTLYSYHTAMAVLLRKVNQNHSWTKLEGKGGGEVLKYAEIKPSN